MLSTRLRHRWGVVLGGSLYATLFWACTEAPPTSPEEVSATTAAQEAKGPKGGAGDVSVSAVDPDTVPADTVLTVRVLGSGFATGSTVSWALSGTPTTAVATLPPVVFVSSRELQARIAVSRDAALARYDVTVTVPGGKKGIGLEKLEVVSKPIVLPVPEGIQSYSASDVNDAGVIVGSGKDQSDLFHALMWTPAPGGWAVEELIPPAAGAGNRTSAIRVNNSGHVVIQTWSASAPSSPRFFIRTPSGQDVPLDAFWVRDLNDQGMIIGSVDGRGPAVLRQTSATSWSDPIFLPKLTGYVNGDVSDINDQGDIVGTATPPGSTWEWPVIWRFDGSGWSPPILVDQDPGAALAVNNGRAVAGAHWPSMTEYLPSLPAFWATPGATRQLLPVAETRSGYVNDMNDGNRIVGEAQIKAGKRGTLTLRRPVVWVPGRAEPIDLGALLSNGSGEARAINDAWPTVVVGHVDGSSGLNRRATAWIVF